MTCSFYRCLLGIAAVPGLFAAFLVASAAAEPAELTVSYSVSLAGLPVGKATVDARVEDGRYTIAGTGSVAGISAIFSDGKGKVDVTGTLHDQKILPDRYSQVIVEDKKEILDMTFSDGRVANIKVTPSKAQRKSEKKKKRKVQDKPPNEKKKSRREIPLTDEHRVGVLDPLSAFLMPVENLDGESVCQRRIPVFDGEHRFDVVMELKRIAKQDGSRYFVCSVAYKPIAGYKPDKKSVKFMVNNKDMEVWLSPIGSSGLVLPVEAHVNTEIGMLVVRARDIKLR